MTRLAQKRKKTREELNYAEGFVQSGKNWIMKNLLLTPNGVIENEKLANGMERLNSIRIH